MGLPSDERGFGFFFQKKKKVEVADGWEQGFCVGFGEVKRRGFQWGGPSLF